MKSSGQCDPRGPFWRAPVLALAVVYVAGLLSILTVRILHYLRHGRLKATGPESAAEYSNKRSRAVSEGPNANGEELRVLDAPMENRRESVELDNGLIMQNENSGSNCSQQNR